MIRILKFPATCPSTSIHSCRRVLSVQLQNGEPMIWAEVDDFLSSTARVTAYATGEEIEDMDAHYVGTVVGIGGHWPLGRRGPVVRPGHLVFHFYATGEWPGRPAGMKRDG